MAVAFTDQEQRSILDFRTVHPVHVFNASLEVIRSRSRWVTASHGENELAEAQQILLL